MFENAKWMWCQERVRNGQSVWNSLSFWNLKSAISHHKTLNTSAYLDIVTALDEHAHKHALKGLLTLRFSCSRGQSSQVTQHDLLPSDTHTHTHTHLYVDLSSNARALRMDERKGMWKGLVQLNGFTVKHSWRLCKEFYSVLMSWYLLCFRILWIEGPKEQCLFEMETLQHYKQKHL